MVRVAAHGLTKLGFRRDVKLFLAVLVGFLVFVILALVLLLQSFLLSFERFAVDGWTDIARSLAARLTDPALAQPDQALEEIRNRFEIAAVKIEHRGRTLRSGLEPAASWTYEMDVPAGHVTVYFDANHLRAMEKRFLWTAALCVTATVAGTLLLLLFMPRVVRPVEQLLDEASALGARSGHEDEESYLIATFKETIATLRRQETELSALHLREKARADELELVASTLTRNLTSGFMAVDPRGRVVEVNAAGRDILGAEIVTGTDLFETLPPGPMLSSLKETFEDTVPRSRLEIAHGARTIGLTIVPLLSAASEKLGIIALFTDLTPMKRLEDRLHQTQALAALGELSAGVAHEVRNSLGAILGYLRLARRYADEEADSRIRRAEDEARALATTVERLLDSSRPLVLNPSRFRLDELLRSTADGLATDVPVTIDSSAGIEVNADATLLRRALDNVLRNAQEAARLRGEGAAVTVKAEVSPAVKITISDNGPGIDGEARQNLFVPFASRKPGGLGLGLFMARKIALLHGGDMEVSSAPGGGAAVTIDIGRAAARND